MNAIIAAATGYGEAELRPFLSSVERMCPGTRLFLIVFKRDQARVEALRARYRFVEPVYVGRKLNRGRRLSEWVARRLIDPDYSACRPLWRSLGRYSLHVTLDRYFLALEIVRGSHGSLDNVLLTDSRDVLLQGDPFGRLGNSLVSGLEERTIGDCPHNSHWIQQMYGTAVLDRLSNFRIVCSGVTVGPARQMEQYLVAMCKEIWRCLPGSMSRPYFDQSAHNYLIYSKQVGLELTENGAGVIATLFYEDRSNITADAETGRLIVRGKLPAVVHQYDRHADLAAFVRQRSD